MRIKSYTVITMIFLFNLSARADHKSLKFGAFQVNHSLTLPGSPEEIFDLVTGDISGWWDHSMSEKPLKLYIEARAGGGFYEIFDEAGNGVKHAEVIYAQRGKILRFDGPLGLSGNAVNLVTSYQFERAGEDSVSLNVTVNASGQMEEGGPETVDRVWSHFLFEQLKPSVEKLQNK